MDAPSHRPAATRAFAAILLAAALLRILALVAVGPTPLMNDELLYHLYPSRMAAGAPLGDAAGRAPGIMVFYAGLYRIFGADVTVARTANVILGIAAVALVFLLGRRFAGERAGLVAAAVAAVYPTLVAFTHYLYTETFYVFLLLLGLVLLVGRRPGPPGVWRAAAAGVCFGLCALTREVGLLMPAVGAGALLVDARPRPRSGLRPAAVLLAASLLTILPWTIALNRHSQGFVLVSRTTWMNLYLGNTPGSHWQKYEHLGKTIAERERAAREIALANIRERMPAWPIEKVWQNTPRFFRPTAFPVLRLLSRPGHNAGLGDWRYRFRWQALDGPGFRRTAAAGALAGYLLVVFPGVAGLALARDRRLAALFGLVILAHLAPTIVAFNNTRFRLPVMPILIVTAAGLAVSPRACWREATGLQRAAAVAGVALLLLMIVSERSAMLSPVAH